MAVLGVAVALGVGVACSPAEPPATAGDRPTAPDAAEVAGRLDAAEAELELGVCTPECLDTLEEFRALLPDDQRVTALLRAAYLLLGDWHVLIRLEEALPAGARTAAEELQLTSVYHRAGRFGDAASRLRALLADDPENADLSRRLAVTLFELGDHNGALARLDRIGGQLTGAEAAEAETLRGLVYFYRGDLPKAQSHLARAVELAPGSLPALSALARVLSAREDTQRAEQVLARAAEVRQNGLAETQRALRLSARSRVTSAACGERDWEACERGIHEMLAAATPREQVGIYRYYARILNGIGRDEEARAALARSQELAAGPGGRPR